MTEDSIEVGDIQDSNAVAIGRDAIASKLIANKVRQLRIETF